MTLQAIQERLTQISGRAVSSKVTFSDVPVMKPPNLPAVWVRWLESTPTTSTHAATGATGRNQKRGLMRTHVFDVTALVATLGDSLTEYVKGREAAEGYMDAIDADNTLKGSESEGVVSRATIRIVQPVTEAWDGVVYVGITARVEVIEI